MRLDRNIAITKLRAPEHAARTLMDDADLDALVESIQQLGVRSPLHVKPLPDGTYEIVAGHRRYLAAQRLNLADVPCRLELDPATCEAWKLHENLFREALSPADEAQFYSELYERHGQDVDRVCALVRRPRAHVEARILLMAGDSKVLDALRRGAISLGVAEQFNAIERPEDREYYLHYAERGGCSVRQAREWRAQANARRAMETARVPGADPALAGAGDTPAAAPSPLHYVHVAKPYELSGSTELRTCLFCGDEFQEWQMYRKFICAADADRYLTAPALRGDRPRHPVDVTSRATQARDSLRPRAADDSSEVNDGE